ncbi:hypothetical protein B0H14DRAFT_2614051 [Mycena olivaceomarginata]|nr:hypothetical protein B0H14DRAFT_2614051 [Mycena olivaceomarginata]
MEWVYAPQLEVMAGGSDDSVAHALAESGALFVAGGGVGERGRRQSDRWWERELWRRHAREERSRVEPQPRKSPREEANESFETWVPLSCARITGVTCFFRVGASAHCKCEMWDPWLQERVPFAKDGAFEMARWLGAERSCPKGEAFEMATGKFEGGTDFCGTCPQKLQPKTDNDTNPLNGHKEPKDYLVDPCFFNKVVPSTPLILAAWRRSPLDGLLDSPPICPPCDELLVEPQDAGVDRTIATVQLCVALLQISKDTANATITFTEIHERSAIILSSVSALPTLLTLSSKVRANANAYGREIIRPRMTPCVGREIRALDTRGIINNEFESETLQITPAGWRKFAAIEADAEGVVANDPSEGATLAALFGASRMGRALDEKDRTIDELRDRLRRRDQGKLQTLGLNFGLRELAHRCADRTSCRTGSLQHTTPVPTPGSL